MRFPPSRARPLLLLSLLIDLWSGHPCACYFCCCYSAVRGPIHRRLGLWPGMLSIFLLVLPLEALLHLLLLLGLKRPSVPEGNCPLPTRKRWASPLPYASHLKSCCVGKRRPARTGTIGGASISGMSPDLNKMHQQPFTLAYVPVSVFIHHFFEWIKQARTAARVYMLFGSRQRHAYDRSLQSKPT